MTEGSLPLSSCASLMRTSTPANVLLVLLASIASAGCRSDANSSPAGPQGPLTRARATSILQRPAPQALPSPYDGDGIRLSLALAKGRQEMLVCTVHNISDGRVQLDRFWLSAPLLMTLYTEDGVHVPDLPPPFPRGDDEPEDVATLRPTERLVIEIPLRTLSPYRAQVARYWGVADCPEPPHAGVRQGLWSGRTISNALLIEE